MKPTRILLEICGACRHGCLYCHHQNMLHIGNMLEAGNRRTVLESPVGQETLSKARAGLLDICLGCN